MPKCAIANCGGKSKMLNDNLEPLKFHRFPQNPFIREKWVIAAGRGPHWQPCRYTYACSRHFKVQDYDDMGWKLLDNTLPSLNLPAPTYTDEDPLQSGVETVVIKVESDEFSEEEDNLLESLEKKRQRETEVTQTETKKPKLDNYVNYNVIPVQKGVEIPVQTNGPSTSGSDKKVMVPEIFMKTMLRTQNDILDTLKTQVLMQNPDPNLLTFLRFLGAKMQKLSHQRRHELIDIITKMVLEEYDDWLS